MGPLFFTYLVDEVGFTIGYKRLENKPTLLSPCVNNTEEHSCHSYCKWHKHFFEWNQINKKEFFTLMKLSQPQRKLKTSEFSDAEMSLSKKIFGVGNNQSIQNEKELQLASMPLVIFCKDDVNQEWLGDDIKLFTSRFCSNFYPTPTDQGLCMTKNLKINDLMSVSEAFSEIFEVDKQKVPHLIQGNRINAKATYIITTNSNDDLTIKTFLRSKKMTSRKSRSKEMAKVFFQIHSTDELPQIEKDSNQIAEKDSLTLEAGHEYFIQVTPIGQQVTKQFQALSFKDRHCLLSHEKNEHSVLKVYKKQNCRYECKVKFAISKCACIPWDFPINLSETIKECDVFGRTCFFNAFSVGFLKFLGKKLYCCLFLI